MEGLCWVVTIFIFGLCLYFKYVGVKCSKCGGMTTTWDKKASERAKKFGYETVMCEKCINEIFLEMEKKRKHQEALAKSLLVACPDCGKAISKHTLSCPHCGCPIADITTQISNSSVRTWEVTDDGMAINEMSAQSPNRLRPVLADDPLSGATDAKTGIPKCPTCGSPNIEKISGGEKACHVCCIGILAPLFKKVRSSFKCNACGYLW
ncbi:MAG: hypothetical protein Q8J64_08795 [Thermodesulfovibrionales bacterium]|nr:hypothetical protein [Thermodesulfovibrionales bacterium]